MNPHTPNPAHTEPRWPHQTPDDTWEQARDAAFSQFVARCLSHIDATGCHEEQRLAAGIHEIYREWDHKREHARTASNQELAARISALGWALRTMAQPAWESRPGWDHAFHPQAVAPGAHTEAAS